MGRWSRVSTDASIGNDIINAAIKEKATANLLRNSNLAPISQTANDAATIAIKQSNWKQVEEIVNSSVGKTSSGAADKSLKAGGKNGTGVTTQKIYTDSNGNPIEELVGNGRRGKVTSNAEQALATPNFVLVGKPYLEQSSVIKPGTTVQLNQSQRLANGEVLPEGSVITTSDNIFKATLPDGTIKKGNVNLIYPQARLNHSIEIGKVIGEYSAIKPGSLNEDMAKTFSGSRYKEVVLDKDTILFRAGTDKIPLGQYFSLEEPLGIMQSRIDKAIPPVWPNGGKSPIDTVFAVKVPAGTKVYVGEVGSQHHAFVGGTQQIIVVKPWEIQGIEIISKRKLK